MRITSKGQVTIPQAIREQSGLLPNTEVEFRLVRGQVVLSPAAGAASRGKRAVERLRASRKRLSRDFSGMSSEQILAFLRPED